MHDIRPSGASEPNGNAGANPPRQPRQFPDVNLHPDYAGYSPTQPTQPDWTAAAPVTRPMRDGVSYEVSGIPPAPPAPESTPEPTPEPAVAPEPAAPAPLPQTDEHLHHLLAGSLRTIKFGLLALVVILAAATGFFLSQTAHPGTTKTTNPKTPTAPPGSLSVNGAAGGYAKSVNCFGQTGPDASTDKQTFRDIDGTDCSYQTGTTKETLVLTGKLTGRNTEGTGMSVNINVNGKLCNGGESLNYARTYTPMISNCVFEVPANSSVAIKWQFLSPFGGSAAVLRSSKNIAPSITGVAIPKTD